MQTEKFIWTWKKNDTIQIDDEKVNKIPECNLIHDTNNPPKRAKI